MEFITMEQLQGSSIESNNHFLFTLLSLSFLLLLFLYKIINPSRKLNLPPSPPKLPLIGNLHQLGKLPHRSLRDLAQKYGPVMLVHFGGAPTLVVSSADATREVMKGRDVVFSNRRRTTAVNIYFNNRIDVVFSPYGDCWRQAKKICVLELLSLKRVQSFQFVREEEVALLMKKIRIASSAGAPVDLSQMLVALSSNIISRCALGRRIEEEDGTSKYGELMKTTLHEFGAITFGDTFPFLKWMDYLTGFIPLIRSTGRELYAILDHAIEEYKNSSGSVDGPSGKKDFVDILLQVQKNGALDFPLTQDDVKAILLDVVIAGADTNAATMQWLMAELARNPRVMKKAQEEVRNIVAEKSKVDMDDVAKMNYLKCIIKETLRLHPPVLLIPRQTSESVELGNYHIPAKTTVYINVYALHTDPNAWDRPEEFIPERFENKDVEFQGQDFQYIPFGGGRRVCPGISFASAAMTYVAANLLYWFDWKLPDGATPEDLDMTELFGLTAEKKTPICLVPVPVRVPPV